MRLTLSPNSIDDYRIFIKVKSLPRYSVTGSGVEFPDRYAADLGLAAKEPETADYASSPWLFDYQRDIAAMAIQRKKFSVFADCGLGKTLIMLEFARHARATRPDKPVLIVSPLMVINQTSSEAERFYGEGLTQLRANELADWLLTGTGIGITNYEAITEDLRAERLSCLILDESSMLKSHYGAWGKRLIEMGRGIEYKLCCTGTPAPNDRIEYANHAVFMDAFPNVNSFLARFFVNRGQTSDRWVLKHHALMSFYKSLSDWCIFLTRPGVYGWKDGTKELPPLNIHVHDVPLTTEQRSMFMDDHGALFVDGAGGIGSRARISQLGKGFSDGKAVASNKTKYVRDLIDSWPDESTIIWCKYNAEQAAMAKAIPGCGNISGSTPLDERIRIIDEFKAGTCKVLVTKPKILGFGLNLQVATRHIFSGLQDSYEEFYQAVKRSNRYGSTKPLNVHIPATELEMPMIETVLEKANRIEKDTHEQEEFFRANRQ